MCCVLILTIFKLGGAADSVFYTLDPIESDSIKHIKFYRIFETPINLDPGKLTFAVIVNPVNPALNILSSNNKVLAKKIDIGYSGEFNVSVAAHTDGVLTGDLSATLSCNHPILCEIEDKTVVETKVIVKETKSKCHCVYTSKCCPNYLLLPTALSVTATPSYDVSQTSPTTDVTVTLSKDLATLENITISVSLQDPQGQRK